MSGVADVLVHATAADGAVRACAVVGTALTEEARARHRTLPTATAALGRALAAAALLGAALKSNQTVMVRILGDGPLGPIVTESTADGSVRGYVTNPLTDLPPTTNRKLDVGGAVGRNGLFHVTRDLGLRDPYQSSVPLVSGEIGDDLASFLVISDQVPSVVAVGVLVAPKERVIASGGFMLQVMPGAPSSIPAYLEGRARVLPPVTQMLSAGATADDVLASAVGELPLAVHDRRPMRFACRCSQAKVVRVLVALGRDEIRRVLVDEGAVRVQCKFCGRWYVFDDQQVDCVFASSA